MLWPGSRHWHDVQVVPLAVRVAALLDFALPLMKAFTSLRSSSTMSSCSNELLLRPTKIGMIVCMAHSRADAAGTCSGSFSLETGALLRSVWERAPSISRSLFPLVQAALTCVCPVMCRFFVVLLPGSWCKEAPSRSCLGGAFPRSGNGFAIGSGSMGRASLESRHGRVTYVRVHEVSLIGWEGTGLLMHVRSFYWDCKVGVYTRMQ